MPPKLKQLDGYTLAARMRDVRDRHGLSTTAQALFYELVALCNKADWADVFSIKTQKLCTDVDISSPKTLNTALNALVETGLVFCKKGQGSGAHIFFSFTTPFENSAKITEFEPGNSVKNSAKITEFMEGSAEKSVINEVKITENPECYKEQTKNLKTTTASAPAAAGAGEDKPIQPEQPAQHRIVAQPGIWPHLLWGPVEELADEVAEEVTRNRLDLMSEVARRALIPYEAYPQLRDFFPGYLSEFVVKLRGEGTYSTGLKEFRKYFVNWLVVRLKKEQEAANNQSQSTTNYDAQRARAEEKTRRLSQ